VDLGLIEKPEDSALLIVGTSDARTRHAPLAEFERAGNASDLLVVVVRRRGGGDDDTVAGREFDAAAERRRPHFLARRRGDLGILRLDGDLASVLVWQHDRHAAAEFRSVVGVSELV